MINVLLYHPNAYPKGGSEVVSYMLAEVLAGKEFRFVVATNQLNWGLIDDKQRCCISAFEESPEGVTHKMWSAKSEWLAGVVRKHEIDILVSQNQIHEDIAYFRSLCPGLRIIHCLHSIPFCNEMGTIAKEIGRMARKSESSLIYRLKYELYVKPFKLKRLRKKVHQSLVGGYCETLENCDAMMVLCDGYKEQVVRETGVCADKIYVIGNATKEAVWQDDFGARKKRLLFVGRLSMGDKRIDRLLAIWGRLMAEFPEWSLDIVGGGDDEADLRQIESELGLERVVWHGWAQYPDKFYAESPIICMTSQFEGFPMVLGEAMSYGCVPIAYNVTAGVERVIGDGGELVTPFDEDEYVAKLRRMMGDEQYLLELQGKALEHIKLFSVEAFGEKYRAMFNSVLGQNNEGL